MQTVFVRMASERGARMIDEKLLIEEFLSTDGIEFKMNFKTGSEEEIIESLQVFADKIREGVLNLIKSQPKVGEWISCSERLPEKYCHCLVTRMNKYNDGFDIDVREDVYIELEGVWDWQSKVEGSMGKIIAWMPLPEPYKE